MFEDTFIQSFSIIEKFPSVGTMNRIAVNEKVHIKLDSGISFDSFIPLVVETSKGIIGVTPVWNFSEEEKLFDCCDTKILAYSVDSSSGIVLQGFHVWDLKKKTIKNINNSIEEISQDSNWEKLISEVNK